jgi:hypothetical protein
MVQCQSINLRVVDASIIESVVISASRVWSSSQTTTFGVAGSEGRCSLNGVGNDTKISSDTYHDAQFSASEGIVHDERCP